MLTRLTIQDVVLIEQITLDFTAGLNVLTGETGAGKSILLDAISLALGGRSDAGLIRAGAKQAVVTAEFNLDPPESLQQIAEERGLMLEDPIILRRMISSDGKSRAFINDQPVSVSLLKQFGECLLEIHGQFETHGLLNATTHRGLLDAYAGLGTEKQQTAKFYSQWQQAIKDFDAASAARSRAEAEEEFLRSAVTELNELSPEAGETEKMAERRTQLQHREKILEALESAADAINGHRGAGSTVAVAGKALARIADKAPGLAEILDKIDTLGHELGEVGKQLTRLLHDMDAEPDALQRIEERLFALRAVARKHGVGAEALLELQQNLTQRLELLTDQSDQLNKLAKAVTTTRRDYVEAAEKLSTARQKCATKLADNITKELPPLKLERAQFVVEVTRLPESQWQASGLDQVTFLATTNPGNPPGALNKVASGGELARFMLALKVVLAASDPVPVLVFDEVDAGIGGATASAVGERLARLAEDVQILVVTHSPQVAARAKNQLRVQKTVHGQKAVTEVITLDHDERIEEIARMLSGAQVTEAARQAALSLLDDATAPKRTTKRAGRS